MRSSAILVLDLVTLPCRGRVGDANAVSGAGVRWRCFSHPTPLACAALRRATLPLQGRVKTRARWQVRW